MTEQHIPDTLGPWAPGAHELERFREDLYLRILGTTEVMHHLLDTTADGIITAVQEAAAKGLLHEDRADVELGKVVDCVEHQRYVANWAHVMLTTRVVDVLRALSWLLVEVRPKGNYYKKDRSEVQRLEAEFADRFGITLGDAPTGTGFLEGMVVARNKIVHNAGMLWEASSQPNTITTEGEPWTPKAFDQDFATRFPEYVDGERITIKKEPFDANVTRSVAFVEWVCERFDEFVQLLDASPQGGTPS